MGTTGNGISTLILAVGTPFLYLFEFQQSTEWIQIFCGQWRRKSNRPTSWAESYN